MLRFSAGRGILKPSLALAVGTIWLAVAAVLASHFRFYFGVGWHDAVKWGLGDGFVWCLLLVALGLTYQRYIVKPTLRWRIGAFVCAAVVSAVALHPTAVVLLYWAIDGAISRPFPEDVAHLAMKRLPQGILAGLLLSVAGMAFGAGRAMKLKAQDATGERGSAETAASGLLLKSADGFRRVSLSEVRYAEAAGNYVSVHTTDGTHLERTTLTALAKKLEPQGFRRISRKHLVNLHHVRSIRSRKPKGGVVILDGTISLPISRNYKAEFLRAVAAYGGSGKP